jgi:hypothetical protein
VFTDLWYPMEQLIDLEDASGQERRPSESPRPPRPTRTWNASVVRVLAASVVTMGVVAIILLMPSNKGSGPAAEDTAPSATGKPNSTSAQAKPTTPPSAEPAPKPAAAVAMDNRGFVNSKARCEGAQNAVAIGRTQRSLVVVCESPNGAYEYKGVRLSDGAALTLADVRVTPGGFEARSDGATYVISPKELVVTSGNATLARDAMVEYRPE